MLLKVSSVVSWYNDAPSSLNADLDWQTNCGSWYIVTKYNSTTEALWSSDTKTKLNRVERCLPAVSAVRPMMRTQVKSGDDGALNECRKRDCVLQENTGEILIQFTHADEGWRWD